MVRTPQIEVQICAALQAGISRTAACESVNVSRSTFYQWLKTDPAFAEAVARAEAEAEYGFTTTVHETAIGHEVRKIKESRETVVTVRRTLYPDGQVTEEVVPVELVTTSTEESFEFDWRAAAWWLERRRSDVYGRKAGLDLNKHAGNAAESKPPVFAQILAKVYGDEAVTDTAESGTAE